MANPEMMAEFNANHGEKVRHSDTARVLRALRNHHGRISYNGGRPSEHWAYFEELPVATGMNVQKIDAWAIALWPSRRWKCVAYEVKSSRGDFMAEMRNEGKRLGALAVSNEFYFAAPEGLLKAEEMPAEAGLIEVRRRGGRIITKPAPWREMDPLPLPFVASIARRAVRA